MTDTTSSSCRENTVSGMYKYLRVALMRLSAHIEAHGMIDDREDEILAIGSLYLKEATESGMIDADGGFSDTMAVVPLDDAANSLMDTALSDSAVEAGIAVFDQIGRDNADYVAGVTTDWDDGMASIAVFRAMARAMRTGTYLCRLHPDDGDLIPVTGISRTDAVRNYALSLFHEMRGDWMSGTVTIMADGLPDDLDPADFACIFGINYDVSIEFVDEAPTAVVRRKFAEETPSAEMAGGQ